MKIPLNLSLDNMLDMAFKHAQTTLIGSKESLIPAFLVVPENDQPFIVGVPFPPHPFAKEIVIEAMRALMLDRRAIQYSFVSEAWAASISNEELDSGHYDPPSQSPHRVEVVIALATDGVETKYRQWKIIRGAKGKCVALEPDAIAAGMPVESRFEGLLPKAVLH